MFFGSAADRAWEMNDSYQLKQPTALTFKVLTITESQNDQTLSRFDDYSNIPAGGRGLWRCVSCRLRLSTRDQLPPAAPLPCRNLEQHCGSPKPVLLLALPCRTLLQQYWTQPAIRDLWHRYGNSLSGAKASWWFKTLFHVFKMPHGQKKKQKSTQNNIRDLNI